MADARTLFDSACDRVLDRFQSGKFKRLATEGIRKASNIHKLNYVTDTIGWSRVQSSLLGEARGTERAAEIEPNTSTGRAQIIHSQTSSL